MKHRFLIISIFFLTNCGGPIVTFNDPQPTGQRSQSNITKRLRGEFISVDKKTRISILEKVILKSVDFEYRIHKDSLGSDYKIQGDTILGDSGKFEIAKIIGDSIVQHYHHVDTLFIISINNVLKKFRGYYFLNTRYGLNSWMVQKVSLVNGILSIASIESDQEIGILKQLAEKKSDTSSYSLTRSNFKLFIKLEGFHDREVFMKIRENRK
jgi:hypothetical protein